MISKFSKIVMAIAGSKKEMNVYKPEGIARDIERKLDKGEIDLAEAMNLLKSSFRYNLSNDDYRKIEKETNYNLH